MIVVTQGILDEMVDTLVQEIAPEQIYLFGFRARGNAITDSDIDLLIVESEPFGINRSRWKSWRTSVGLYHGFESRKISWCIARMKLPHGSTLSITSFLAAYVRGSCSMSDHEHARLMLRMAGDPTRYLYSQTQEDAFHAHRSAPRAT